MKMVVNGLLAFILLITSYSCDTTEPVEDSILVLTVEDVSCTEAWLKLSTEIQLPVTIILKQDDAVRITINLIKPDTLLFIDSLLPNRTYSFQTVFNQTASENVTARTMDTTSHNFTWQTWTFGDIGSSTIYDVAIIDENNIWCVGDIKIRDTTENGYTPYNIAHWNGERWELKVLKFNCRLYYPNCGPDTMLYTSASSIFAFGPDDIWIAAGTVHHFNGITWTEEAGMEGAGGANKIWGNENELWFVGNNGFIVHRNTNGKWSKIESGTDLQILDIYGAEDKNGELEILAVATRNYPIDRKIVSIKGNSAEQISSEPILWELYALWFIPGKHYYLAGSGIYEKRLLTDPLWKNEPLDITRYGTSGIRGNGLNDLFVGGAFGEFLHFNGISWKSFINETGMFNGGYGGLSIKEDLVITVGFEGTQAKIMMGKRKN